MAAREECYPGGRDAHFNDEVRVITRKLFESFLDNPGQYWEALVSDVAKSMNQANEWHQWISRVFANGTPMELDGNPICDGRSDVLGRAFRIIQHEPWSDDVEISAWVETNEPEFEALPGDELIIALSLSQESADLARLLLRKWMRAETSPEEMDSFINEILSG